MSSSLCGSCAVNFTLFKKKNRCTACKLLFCTTCFKKGQSLPQRNVRHCLKCHAFSSNPYIPAELMLLTVKELKAFLQQSNVSAVGCREKKDLVDVIIHHQRPRATSTENTSSSSPASSNTEAGTSNPNQSTSSTRNDQRARENFFGLMQTVTDHVNGPNVRDTNHFVESLLAGMDLGHLQHNLSSQTSSDNGSSSVHYYQDAEMRDESASPAQPASTAWSMKSGGSKVKGANLDSIKSVEDIQKLSVRQLKSLLDENFVDYTGCLEKDELVERTVMLWQSKMTNAQASQNDDSLTGESDVCKVCMDNCVDCVLLECGHLVTCIDCGKKLKECPMCRRNITRIVRVFKS